LCDQGIEILDFGIIRQEVEPLPCPSFVV